MPRSRSQRPILAVTAALLMFLIIAAWFFGPRAEGGADAGWMVEADRATARFAIAHRSRVLTESMRVVTLLGSGAVVATGMGLAAVYSYVVTKDRRWPRFFALAIVGIALDNVGKAMIDRPRPDLEPLVSAAGSAFPSGHATAGAIVCASLALLAIVRWSARRSWLLWIPAAAVASLVGASRVYLGVHWMTDVVAGMCLGFLWVVVCAVTTRILRA